MAPTSSFAFTATSPSTRGVIGGTEERPPACTGCGHGAAGDLYPVIAVNDAVTKWDFDNVYGTGQSTLDGILQPPACCSLARPSSLLASAIVAAVWLCVPVAWANVIITEVDRSALRAVMEGPRDAHGRGRQTR